MPDRWLRKSLFKEHCNMYVCVHSDISVQVYAHVVGGYTCACSYACEKQSQPWTHFLWIVYFVFWDSCLWDLKFIDSAKKTELWVPRICLLLCTSPALGLQAAVTALGLFVCSLFLFFMDSGDPIQGLLFEHTHL